MGFTATGVADGDTGGGGFGLANEVLSAAAADAALASIAGWEDRACAMLSDSDAAYAA